MNFTHNDGDDYKYDNIEEKYNIEFIELSNEQKYSNNNFTITALSLKHGGCLPINGYLLEKNGKKISYACDTTFCDNYDKMCEKSKKLLKLTIVLL